MDDQDHATRLKLKASEIVIATGNSKEEKKTNYCCNDNLLRRDSADVFLRPTNGIMRPSRLGKEFTDPRHPRFEIGLAYKACDHWTLFSHSSVASFDVLISIHPHKSKSL
ncbi:hypothetical protein OIU78_000355 [Salix suchowensis]|nr:hypothetical protein OIU78_000355 [Salix suchowensis]